MTRTTIVRRVAIATIASLVALAAILPAYPALGLSCAQPDRLEGLGPGSAQGTTFMGTYLGSADHPTEIWHEVSHWVVERVYAGAPLPQALSFSSPPCGNVTLTPGERYLFSTSNISEPTYRDSIAWRLGQDGGVSFTPFWYLERRQYGGANNPLVAIEEFGEALEVVAPGANDGDPPVDTTTSDRVSGRVRITWPGEPIKDGSGGYVAFDVTNGSQVESDDTRLDGPAVVRMGWDFKRSESSRPEHAWAWGSFNIRNDEGAWRVELNGLIEGELRPRNGEPAPYLMVEYGLQAVGEGEYEGLLLFGHLMPAPDLPGWMLDGWIVPEYTE